MTELILQYRPHSLRRYAPGLALSVLVGGNAINLLVYHLMA